MDGEPNIEQTSQHSPEGYARDNDMEMDDRRSSPGGGDEYGDERSYTSSEKRMFANVANETGPEDERGHGGESVLDQEDDDEHREAGESDEEEKKAGEEGAAEEGGESPESRKPS
jgi:hypothetical protein